MKLIILELYKLHAHLKALEAKYKKHATENLSSFFSVRQQPYNNYQKKIWNPLSFIFFFADIWYRESFKANLESMYCKLSSFMLHKWAHLPPGFDFIALITIKLGVIYIHGIWKHPEELSTGRKGTSLTAYP